MRRLSPLLALLFITPAFAEPIDCAVIKSTTHPFEITFDWTAMRPDKEPLAVQMHRQVIRKADETVVYEFFSPAKFTRRTSNPNGFRMQVRSSGEAATAARFSTYSIDVSKDYFALGKPFEFKETVKGEDGAIVADMDTAISFDGTVNVDVGGCTYALMKIIETSHGTARGKAGSNRMELWYSRDLKASLYTRSEDGDGPVIEMRARDISTSFKPVE